MLRSFKICFKSISVFSHSPLTKSLPVVMPFSKCPILLLDGGLGTTLESAPYSFQFSSSTPLWSSHLLISSPDTILAAQKEFVKAGCNILLTATYQAGFEGFLATLKNSSDTQLILENRDIVDDASDNQSQAAYYMRRAVKISKEAFVSAPTAQGRGEQLIGLSLGAYGACMSPSQEYTGNYDPPTFQSIAGLQAWHKKRLDVFTQDEQTWKLVDIVAFETVPLVNEIHAVRKAMSQAYASGTPSKKWYISCVFPRSKDVLPDDSPVEEVIKAMLENDAEGTLKPWGIGINCTKTWKLTHLIQEFEAAVKQIKLKELEGNGTGHADRKWPWLVLCPDGAPKSRYNTTTQQWEDMPRARRQSRISWDQEIFDVVKATKERALWSGVLVGGCCKTAPEDIDRLRKRIDEL